MKIIIKSFIPYIGIPVICIALLIIRCVQNNMVNLLEYEVLLIFGYVVSMYDIKENKIPNMCVILMLGTWCAIIIPKLIYDTATVLPIVISSVTGCVITGIIFLLVYKISRKGLGGGDVKYMSVAGLYLGFQNALPAILYGTILSAITGGIMILIKKMGRKDAIPLAPFLYIGILLTIFLR